MKKKLIAILLSVVCSIGLLSGCGEESSNSGTASSQEASEVNETDNDSPAETGSNDEIVEIIWQYPTTMDTDCEGFRNVENALNEMMERDIGVHVTFEPVGLSESQNAAILAVSAGERLDIMLSAFTSIGNVVDDGLIIPLDDLLDKYGQDILEHSYTKELCGFNGATYGVCTGNTLGNDQYGYMIKKKYWDKYDLANITNWTEEKFYTMEEMEHIFEIVKAGEGENFYCDVPPSTEARPLNGGYIEYDYLSGSLSGGVLMLNRDFSDTTVYNLFETPEYEEYCKIRYKWAQKGYIAPDAAVTTESAEVILAQDNYLGMFYNSMPQDMIVLDKTIGEELVCLDMIPRFQAYKGGSVIQWSIPITCENPEKAMQALNYIYKNPEATWLIQFGIEGSEYEVVEEDGEHKVIRYLAENTSDLPYYMVYGLWGNVLQWPSVEPQTLDNYEKQQALDDAVPQERYSPAFGYSFVQEPVATELAAVNAVINQYTPSFNAGSLNPEQALPEFIDALKAAGIDTIIAEQQKQFDAWLANK